MSRGSSIKTRTKVLGALALILISFTASADSTKGVVVFYQSGCDYFIVETTMGFSLVEWYGGYDPSKGDVLFGDFASYGFTDIYDITADSKIHVWREDYWLSKDDVVQQYFEQCQ